MRSTEPGTKIPSVAQSSTAARDFLGLVFKHKTLVTGIFLATVGIVAAASFLMPQVYEAKSTLLMRFGKEYASPPQAGDRGAIVSPSQEEAINSEVKILSSRDLIQGVVSKMTVESLYPELLRGFAVPPQPVEAATQRFEKNLSVEAVRRSNVLQVSFRHRNPKLAAEAVNLLVDGFKEKHLAVFSQPGSTFLEGQLKIYAQRLRESENELQEFKKVHQIYAMEEQRSLLLKQRAELETETRSTQSRVVELQTRLSNLRAQSVKLDERGMLYTPSDRDRIITEAKAKLLTFQIQEQQLLKKYKESNRLVIAARSEIQLVQDFLKEQEAEIGKQVKTGNPLYQDLEKEIIRTGADLQAQEYKEKVLRAQMNQVDGTIQTLEAREVGLQNLKRDLAANEKNYRAYLEKVEEARASEDMNRGKIANISIVQPAAVPSKPAAPRRGLNILAGIILGAAAALSAAFISDRAAQEISTPEQAEKSLGLPILASIARRGR